MRAATLALLLPALMGVLSGCQSLLAHYQTGDLLAQSCTVAEAAAWSGSCPSYLVRGLGQTGTAIGAILGLLSPGLARFKIGFFSRES